MRSHREDVQVDLTTELRWFFDGPVPADVVAWFTHDGTLGLAELRCDSYRLDGRIDEGVKRRDGTILELKRRQGRPDHHRHGDLDGQREIWQRWSPADHMIDPDPDTRWVEVEKAITKRRFDPDGSEARLTEATRAMTGDGCDAEVAGVTVAGRSMWTFALAAFGGTGDRTRLLDVAWDGLVHDHPAPMALRLERSNSSGYPEWIRTFLQRDSAIAGQPSRPLG